MIDYSWTTGGDKTVAHVGVINIGGHAEVHKVMIFFYLLTRVSDEVSDQLRSTFSRLWDWTFG
jgi:hypothetical protein